MALHGIEKHHELRRSRILRDTRPFMEQVFETMGSLQAIVIVYVCLVFCLVFFSPTFEIVLILAAAYAFVPMQRKNDIPLRIRKSLGEVDGNDIHPGTRKPRVARGIGHLGNRLSDNAEIWADGDLLKTHVFEVGSTGAGKTEALISLSDNALNWVSGYFYGDGKGDVSCFAKHFSLCRAKGREDDVFVINYMTGNVDTTKKRADKLSNSYNPQTVGNAESNIQLLVGLMDASDGKGDMWKGRAITFISSYMPALVELRDKGLVMLYIGLVRATMPFNKYLELMANPNISQRSREMMQAYLADVPGYKRDKNENQSSTFLEQYGFQQMQFTRILSSLADTYGHIYNTPQGEVNLRDVVTNRRILLVLLPALEKSRPELGNLGKIIVAGMKGMMGSSLGSKLEGSKLELLDSRATNAPAPYLAIFDEFGYYMPEDAALMWAQARSLNFSLVAAGQDLQAFYRTSKEETLAIISNSNIKMVGKLEDPTDTFELFEKLAGEAYVSVVDGYEQNMSGMGGFRGAQTAKIDRVARIELQDLQRQVEGELHIFVKGEIIRARAYYADPKLAKQYRLNHFLKVPRPDADVVARLKINTRALLETLRSAPLGKQRPTDGYFAYAGNMHTDATYAKYLSGKLGVERGITLLMKFDDSAVAPLHSDAEVDSAGGGLASAAAPTVGLAQPTPAAEPVAAADTAAAGGSLAAAPVAPDALAFDGGQLEAVNVFASRPRPEFSVDVMALAAAALPILETIFEEKLVVPVPVSAGEVDDGQLAAADTQVKLNAIVLGMGGSPADAQSSAAAIVKAATDGTEYPTPPKPTRDGKDEEMEEVLGNLEALIGGR